MTERERKYLDRYLGMSEELRQAYELKEAYCAWIDWAKTADEVSRSERTAGSILSNGRRDVTSCIFKDY